MDYDFNADEIFEAAEQIERNGAEFYRNSAETVSDPSAKKFLLDLAEMELDHEKTFASLRGDLNSSEKEQMIFDPDNQTVQYLHALADMRVFYKKEINISSMEEILKSAIDAEKDSIVFYLGMKDLVPENRGRRRLDSIIKEEMSHINLLSKKLRDIRK